LVVQSSVSWPKIDVTNILPEDWQDDIKRVAAEADFQEFPRTPVLSREAQNVAHISRGRVHAHQVQQRLPWLYKLYRTDFLDLVQGTSEQTVVPALDDRYGVVLNVQHGKKMRFECHVDSNPLTGLLFCTDHPGGGGELVFGHDPAAADVESVERNRTVISPRAGQLVVFDGQHYPHYARPLLTDSEVRVVAVMNFYTESRPESTRPSELNRHLYGRG
jgi:hypothetical protein